jgi:hypothetical protein
MIVINGSKIIDIKTNNFTINAGIYRNEFVYSTGIQLIGALDINTGDLSEYALIINKTIYTDIEITNLSNTSGIEIINNKIQFTKVGDYNIELKYKTVIKQITIHVKDIIVTLT